MERRLVLSFPGLQYFKPRMIGKIFWWQTPTCWIPIADPNSTQRKKFPKPETLLIVRKPGVTIPVKKDNLREDKESWEKTAPQAQVRVICSLTMNLKNLKGAFLLIS